MPTPGASLRVHEVHVQAYGDAVGVVGGVFQGVGHDFAHAALVNVAHGEDANAGFFDQAALLGVEIANAHQHDILRLDFRLEAQQVNQLWRAVAHYGGQRHAMNVARRR